MRLTVMTDYALRVLMYAAATPDRLVTIDEITRAYGVSRNHLTKVVQELARHGFIETTRGRGGGIRLGKPAANISIGDVVRAMEDGFGLVECFRAGDACRITPVCRLRGVLDEALHAFLEALDRRSLADLVARPKALFAAFHDA
jgi:Rrf2 family nitric oxide-sensitive transcriptional repressor